ncbi:MAG: (Fe-S)-binding protein [Desulfobacterales bacterium]|nr:(Fe-S)-binding protein [Desulfobacterales bacterium]MBF0395542.1 (Fe-S)-binding protein [Desulfobacterales bacterium]
METVLISPAKAFFLFIPTIVFSVLIPIIGASLFTYIIAKRLAPLVKSKSDPRFDNLYERFINLLKIGIGQYRQPRYMMAGVLHIIIFAGFMILSIRSMSLVIIGISENFVFPGLYGIVGTTYNLLKDVIATGVLAACIAAIIRRGVFKPERYSVPKKYGKDHTAEAVFVLLLISTLMLSEMSFEASLLAANAQKGIQSHEIIIPGTGVWFLKNYLSDCPIKCLQSIHLVAYYIHDIVFFFFLCFLPMGKHFHVITSLPNVFFGRTKKGTIKPVSYDVDEDKIDQLESFGVKKFEDFTWKQILDFYSCADCGRCSDNCPANAVGRPLSPRFISIKGREYAFSHYPLQGKFLKSEPLIGTVYSEDEIWSCTTCGACEEECPIMIEYINKIVDLRRGMVDDGLVPQSLQKPLKALENRGNPYGKVEKKRADWAKEKNFVKEYKVKLLDQGDTADVLYFVDSITSYDDKIQSIGRSTAKVLTACGIDFGVLGPAEADSGNEVRRFGEEMLFQDLRNRNTEAILEAKVKKIVTADPHALNALKNDYKGLPPVEHISEVVAKAISDGKLKLKDVEDENKVYTYHDPCYLGRHNTIYDAPRNAIDAIPKLKRVEMSLKCKDRSFCCGGGGLMLFYEPHEETRMGVLRVKMANKAGANVIVTACPFCMVNIEDAIKTSGLEGKMEVIDFAELIERHIIK